MLRSYVLMIPATGVFPRLDECAANPGVEIVPGQRNLPREEENFLLSGRIARLDLMRAFSR
jgi:hypothetical protein